MPLEKKVSKNDLGREMESWAKTKGIDGDQKKAGPVNRPQNTNLESARGK